MFRTQHAPTQGEGECACGWKSSGTSTPRRQLGLRRHLQAARSRGEMVTDEGLADPPAASDTYDPAQTDTPRAIVKVYTVLPMLFNPIARFIISLVVLLVFMFVALRHARAAIPGILFGTISIVVLLIAITGLGMLTVRATPAISNLVYGPPIAGPNSPRRRLLQLVMRSAQSYKYTFSADVEPAIKRYEALDWQYGQRLAASGDRDTKALLAFVDPRTGTAAMDVLRSRNLETGGSGFHFAALAETATQLSIVAFGILGIFAVLEAEDRVARVAYVQLATGLVLLSAVVLVLILQVRLSATQIIGIEKIKDLMTDADRDLIARIEGKWLYPKVEAKPQFYSVLRRYLLLLHVPIVVVSLIEYGCLFLLAALVTLLWPGTAEDWTGELPRAFVLLAVTAVLYLGAFWAALRVLESLRDVVQPAFVGLVTAVGTVFLMYLLSGSFKFTTAVASIAAALPASIATGFASAFWKANP
jgi:hypothetical protein